MLSVDHEIALLGASLEAQRLLLLKVVSLLIRVCEVAACRQMHDVCRVGQAIRIGDILSIMVLRSVILTARRILVDFTH